MDRNEQIRLLLVCNRGTRLERNERVVLARIDYVSAKPGLQQLAQSASHVQYQVLLLEPPWSNRAGIVAAVAGVNHNFADFQS